MILFVFFSVFFFMSESVFKEKEMYFFIFKVEII